MNPKSIFNLFSPKGKAPTLAHRQLATLAISLALVSLFALTGCTQVPGSDVVVEESSAAIAPEAVIEQETASDSTFLAANPELLKANPPTLGEEAPESTFLANNPELMVARRYSSAIENEGSPPDPYHIETLRAQRYAEAAKKRAESALPATNPELLKAHPPTFDKEGLRHTYFQDWIIEANAADAVKPAIKPMHLRRVPGYTIDAVKPAIQPVSFDREDLRQTYFRDWQIEADRPEPSPLGQPVSMVTDQTSADPVAQQRYKFQHGLGIEAALENGANPATLEDLDAFLEANPELRFIRNHLATAIIEEATNPELAEKLARRQMRTGLTSTFLAANPELMAAGRYEAEVEQMASDAFPRTDRELEFTARYR